MKNIIIITKSSIRLLFLGVAFIAIFSSCGKEVQKPRPNDFTMEVRTELGVVLGDAISNNSDQFDILDRDQYKENVYLYMDSMMTQASNLYYFNNTESGWDQARKWKSFVIQSDEKYAFCIPGGDFYVSTGFLKVMQKDFELYYVMAFELTMMQNEVVINKLFSLGIENIAAISANRVEPGDLSANDVIFSFIDPDFKYDSATVQEMDELTMNYICATSDYDRFGIVDIINNTPQMDGLWFNTRPGYAGRNNIPFLNDIQLEEISRCGNKLKTEGSLYETLILNHLP